MLSASRGQLQSSRALVNIRGMWRFAGFLVSLGLWGCLAADAQRGTRKEYAWAKQVLLGSEIGDQRGVVVRWQLPVHYLIVSPPPRFQAAVEDAFRLLSESLAGSHAFTLEHVTERDHRIGKDGYVTVFPKAPRHATALASLHGAQKPHPNADGWFTIVWNGRFELTRGLVFVDPYLPEKWLRHTALEEMFQALGPSNDSPRIRDSLVFESSSMAGSNDYLARVDIEILRLLYEGLKPGDSARDIERVMNQSWDFGAMSPSVTSKAAPKPQV